MTSQPNRFLTESVKDQLAWAFVVICPLFFSSNMLIARGMSGIFPPISMAFSRWFFVGILVIGSLIILRRFEWRTVLREYRQILFLASLGMGLCGGPVYLAGELTTATNIGLIYSAAPLLIALLAFVGFRETLTKRQGLGLALGLIGVVMILSQAEMARLFDLRFNTGDLWIVLATISFSVYSLGLKYLKTGLSQIQRFGVMALGGALWHVPFMMREIAIRGPWPDLSAQIFGALFVLIFFASIGAYLTYGYIVSRLGATIAGTTLYLSPVYAAILAVIFLDETIMDYHVIGGALILPGLLLVSQKRKPMKGAH